MPATVFSVFGPRAGVGKTIFAVNFAYALAKQKKSKVLLVDLDPHDCGDIALMLGISSPRSMADLNGNVPSREQVETELKEQGESVKIFPGVRNVRKIASLDPEKVASLLSICSEMFSYIVIDSGSDIHPLSIKAFEASSSILFVTTPEILTLQRTTHSLADLQALAVPSQIIQVIINQFNPNDVITEAIITQKLKKNCTALLPDEKNAIQQSIHQGVPIFSSHPRSPYSVAIDSLIRTLQTAGQLQNHGKQKLKELPSPQTVISQAGQQRLVNHQQLKLKIHQRLIEMLDFRKLSPEELLKQDESALEELRVKTQETIMAVMDKMPEIGSREERQNIAKEVLNEALGLGPLEELLADPDINEILVNKVDQVYVERKGKLMLTPACFTSEKHLLGVIERIVAPIGRRIDEKTPMVDARLRDGSRVHAIIPPLSLNGPMITIRKFSRGIFKPEQLIQLGTFSDEMADFFRACVELRLNMIISGGTGTGKTTLLNILASYISNSERIITVEDSAELRLPQQHVGRLEARPSNLQGEGAIPIRELVRNTLRMRPDRIIVGECRGAEALDMLQAMNTGHDGSMTTIHANSPRDCISRLETLVMFSGLELPSRAIREQIASAISLIVQLTRMSDGTRKITAVTEVTGMEGNNVQLQDIFLYRQTGVDSGGKVLGSFVSTGLIPSFATQFKAKGIQLPKGLFANQKP